MRERGPLKNCICIVPFRDSDPANSDHLNMDQPENTTNFKWQSGKLIGYLGIAPTRNYTHFFKIGFVIAGNGFYSYHIHQGNKSDKKRKIVRKSKVLCIQKDLFFF